MKRVILLSVVCLVMLSSYANAAYEWRAGTGENTILGSESPADIDSKSYQNIVAPIDRLLSNYKRGCDVVYASAATLTVETGEVVCSNADGSIRKFRKNTSNVTVAWTDIDTGAEAASTNYYVYAVADADATTFTCKISASSSAPTGVTYYKRLCSFYNDSSSNIVNIVNDGSSISEDMVVKGWINFDGTGTVSIRDSANVTSIADNGTGKYTVTWDTDFADANYCVVVSAVNATDNTRISGAVTYAAGSVTIETENEDGSLADSAYINVIAIGDQ